MKRAARIFRIIKKGSRDVVLCKRSTEIKQIGLIKKFFSLNRHF